MPKRVAKCSTKETDPNKAAKRLKNNEAARRYRERKRKQLELKQKCWEALQRDHHKLFVKYWSRKNAFKWIKLIKDKETRQKWAQRFGYEME